MSGKYTIVIQVNPFHPGQYLTCCGIFAISAQFDHESMSYWTLKPKSMFTIRSELNEDLLNDILIDTFTNSNHFTFFEISNKVIRMDLKLETFETKQLFHLDWWYETLSQGNDIAKKSAWKMYAGNQKPQGTMQKMVKAASEAVKEGRPDTITQLLNLHQGTTGRFGYDCRSSRKALDAGFSANDIPN
ncbi:MAG: hypothetical protein ETSY2_12715 [Candidatus Entotheonella gemina]|uniref:Uncharacterized protein n=1 Tax=Candidatus Entotheonella gemina TaxID=1429439 RepID=W4M9W4_9BACT|nr:MAG: hypothetical protein ETSY2_12715 [Candidatus Entotheonella gemina]